jgi:hypothetical protein
MTVNQFPEQLLCYFDQLDVLRLFITRQAMYAERNSQARSRNHCCSGKAKNITYFECLFELLSLSSGKKISYLLRSIILSSVDCLGPPHFSILSHTKHDFRE